MVRGAVVFLLLLPSLAMSITAEELRELAGLSANAAREKAGRINDGDLSGLLPEKPRKAPTAPAPEQPRAKPVSQKYSPAKEVSTHKNAPSQPSKVSAGAAQGGASPASVPKAKPPSSPYDYIPPPRGGFNAEDPIYTYALQIDDSPEFGIATGTWLDAEVVRDVNNAEPGPVEIRVTSAVVGKYQTLPANAVLFASTSYNAGTRRLELTIGRGVTPSGQEFDLQAQVYDLREVSGLSGIIKERQVVEGGVGRGLVAAGRAVVATTARTSAVGAGLDAAAGTMLDEGDRRANERLQVGNIIYVSRQPVRVFVLSSF